MAIRPASGSESVDRAIDDVGDDVERLRRHPMAGAVRLAPVTFTSAGVDVLVAHGLGRPMRGFQVERLDAAAIVYDGSASAQPRKVFNLRASAPCTATLLVW